jgi:hypothetical protein
MSVRRRVLNNHNNSRTDVAPISSDVLSLNEDQFKELWRDWRGWKSKPEGMLADFLRLEQSMSLDPVLAKILVLGCYCDQSILNTEYVRHNFQSIKKRDSSGGAFILFLDTIHLREDWWCDVDVEKMGQAGEAVNLVHMESTSALLESFWTLNRYARWITWNGRSFDLPVIANSSAIAGVKILRHLSNNRYKMQSEIDLVDLMNGFGAMPRPHFDGLCSALGIESPKEGDVTGANLWTAVLENRIGEILRYNLADLRALKRAADLLLPMFEVYLNQR